MAATTVGVGVSVDAVSVELEDDPDDDIPVPSPEPPAITAAVTPPPTSRIANRAIHNPFFDPGFCAFALSVTCPAETVV